ncbi:hypothetical protein E4U53_004757 [Claviceps sorghi]|nr:hypothetical protein E4U53_004757 [Claviceps sorghi]
MQAGEIESGPSGIGRRASGVGRRSMVHVCSSATSLHTGILAHVSHSHKTQNQPTWTFMGWRRE